MELADNARAGQSLPKLSRWTRRCVVSCLQSDLAAIDAMQMLLSKLRMSSSDKTTIFRLMWTMAWMQVTPKAWTAITTSLMWSSKRTQMVSPIVVD